MNRELFPETERDAWIFLNHIPNLGSLRFHRLLHAAKSARGVLESPVSGLEVAELPRETAERLHRLFRDAQILSRWDAERQKLAGGLCQVVTELDDEYPASLRELVGRPPVLYYKGRWPIPTEKVLGLVGTRHPSPYGQAMAQRLTRDLCARGFVTVSGLAQGIDACIHEATLRAGGHTVAILGCGLGQFYPMKNTALQQRISQEGTLISEFPYEAPPQAWNFPQRNRVISGLAQGVVVIQAGQPSGAAITARFAAEQGRDVFAVPGSVLEPMSAGCHRLIQQGAKLVTTAQDILEDLGIEAADPAPLPNNDPDFDTLSALEKLILQLLTDKTLSADELSRQTSRRFDQVASSLLALELKGKIRALPGQRYAKS